MICWLLLLISATTASAQRVTGVVLDARDREGVHGAIVRLLDVRAGEAAASFTNQAGEATINAPAAGRYRLQVQRIGFRDTDTDAFEVSAGEVVHRTIIVNHDPVPLAGITASVARRCSMDSREGHVVASLWGEAAKALGAARLVDRQALYRYHVRRDTRQLEVPSMRVVRDSVRNTVGYLDGKPFVSAPASLLIEQGFIQETDQGTYYYAPDADVLLSDQFARHYCWRLAVGNDERTVGIAFEPAARVGPPAIRGSLWLDAATLHLQRLEYSYTRADLPEGPAERIGGEVAFERLPGGEWIVRSWQIRMPIVAERQLRLAGWLTTRRIMVGMTEEVGAVLEIVGNAGEALAHADLSAIRGTIVDSVAQGPLAGATVFLDGTDYSTEADSSGAFAIDAISPGKYSLSFTHPKLTVYGMVVPRVPLEIAPGTDYELLLAIPAAAAASDRHMCPEWRSDRSVGEHGVIVGRARDELSGVSLPGARILLKWRRDGRSVQTHESTTGPDGSFVACGVATGAPLEAEIRYLGRSSGILPVEPLGTLAFAEVELTLSQLGSGLFAFVCQISRAVIPSRARRYISWSCASVPPRTWRVSRSFARFRQASIAFGSSMPPMEHSRSERRSAMSQPPSIFACRPLRSVWLLSKLRLTGRDRLSSLLAAAADPAPISLPAMK